MKLLTYNSACACCRSISSELFRRQARATVSTWVGNVDMGEFFHRGRVLYLRITFGFEARHSCVNFDCEDNPFVEGETMPTRAEPEQPDKSLTREPCPAPVDPRITPHPDQVVAHLANERTFLAWSFTSLFIMSSGVGLARTLVALNTSPLMAGIVTGGFVSALFYPTTMGLLFLGSGLLVMIMSVCRYMSVQEQIIERRYRPSSTWVMVYLALILGICAVLAGYLLQLRGAL